MKWPSVFTWDRIRRLLRRSLVRAAATVLALGVLVWLAAARGVGMGIVVPAVLHRVAPEGWSVRVGRVDGSWTSRLVAHDVEIRGPGADASAAEVRIRFRLLPLLSRTVDVTRVVVTRPRGTLVPRPPGPDRSRSPAASAPVGGASLLTRSPLGSWRVEVGDLRIRQGRVILVGNGDRVRVEGVRARGRATLTPEGLDAVVDSLDAEVARPPATSERGAGPAHLVLAARLRGGSSRSTGSR